LPKGGIKPQTDDTHQDQNYVYTRATRSDPPPASLAQAVDTEDDQAGRREDQQDLAERLVPQREQRLVDAASLSLPFNLRVRVWP
jgi:hypothetical protein